MRALSGMVESNSIQVKSDKPSRRKDSHGRQMVKHAPPSQDESSIRDKIAKMKAKKEMKQHAAIAEHEANQKKSFKSDMPTGDEKIVVKQQPKTVQSEEGIKKPHLNAKGEPIAGAIGSNDPKSPEVQGKLKDILKFGGFNFSDKERNALSAILKDS